jgi:hypothetical protein
LCFLIVFLLAIAGEYIKGEAFLTVKRKIHGADLNIHLLGTECTTSSTGIT